VRLDRLTVRGFRNLADAILDVPPAGAVLLGANGQGKTNLLEAIAYPVLFRSFRGAQDLELVRFGASGFRLTLDFQRAGRHRSIGAGFGQGRPRKQLELDGAPVRRLIDAAGQWLAVVFAPEDVRLAAGAAAGRRLFLDRTLALSDPGYLAALGRYREALAQRNAALRLARSDLARVFDPALAASGAVVMARRMAWVHDMREAFPASVAALGEPCAPAELAYQGTAELADPAAWPARLTQAETRDLARRATTVGPHRDDLVVRLAHRPVREFGSTGQHRSVAIALKLLELETIERARGLRPALLLDDVFAELDAARQQRLAARLFEAGSGQVFITSPRAGELPQDLGLPVWWVEQGRVAA
jgi:DNA replication and repair protein RecF